MHKNIILGFIIGALGGLCLARGWWLSWLRTRQHMSDQQARCVVMEEVVRPETAPLQILSGRLQLGVITQSMPPMVRLQARQPFFLLSRQQVHQLGDVLSSADDQLRQLHRAANLPVDQTNDTTQSSLDKKVRFVKRPVCLPHPAILSMVDALTVELTQAELMILMVRVFFLSLDIENEDADGFYAEVPSGEGLRHLMLGGNPDRHDPALCGSSPGPGVFWFFAFQGEPDQDQVCPVCRALWMDLATASEQPLQDRKSLPDDPSSQDLAHYDV